MISIHINLVRGKTFFTVAVNRNEVFFIYFLYFTHVTTCFGPCGPSSGEHYRFLGASFIACTTKKIIGNQRNRFKPPPPPPQK
jgi:hypothetical protein